MTPDNMPNERKFVGHGMNRIVIRGGTSRWRIQPLGAFAFSVICPQATLLHGVVGRLS